MKHLEEYTKHLGREDSGLNLSQKIRGDFCLFYQAHQAKRKQGGILKSGKTRTHTRKFYTKYCAALLRRILTGTTELVENNNISQYFGYSQLNQYLCACLKLLKKERYSGQSVISTEMIKFERVCMLMNMVQSRRIRYSKSM